MCENRTLSAPVRRRLRRWFGRRTRGPFDISHNRIRYRLYPAENHCDRILFGRGIMPEAKEHKAIQSFLRPEMVYVDIGANIGSYTLFVAKHAGFTSRVIAIEPHPLTFQKLEFNLGINGFNWVTRVNCACGPEESEMTLWSDGGGNVGHTSLLPAGTSNPKVGHQVKVLPLHQILASRAITRIDLLKIDIEGFEDQALMPFFEVAEPTLRPRRILLEMAHASLWQEPLSERLAELGYVVVFETAENQLFELPQTN
ncbi:MAG: FkbM family methyltransferase [Pseudomonadota bacterium]